MNFRKLLIFITLICLMSLVMAGCNTTNNPASTPEEEEQVTVIASTSWTALMAQAAGAKNVTIIAPVELKHPPEYDFKPSDIQTVQNADWIIMAGYEGFMKKILESNDISEDKIIKVVTTNTFENLSAQTKIIAEKLGTTELQQQWESELSSAMDDLSEKANAMDVSNIKVLVHSHMAAFTTSLGYQVVGTFGAEELSPAKMGELANLKPDLIIDNYHNPQGATIAELSKAERVELRNFPGPEHKSLIDLLIDNAKKLGIE